MDLFPWVGQWEDLTRWALLCQAWDLGDLTVLMAAAPALHWGAQCPWARPHTPAWSLVLASLHQAQPTAPPQAPPTRDPPASLEPPAPLTQVLASQEPRVPHIQEEEEGGIPVPPALPIQGALLHSLEPPVPPTRGQGPCTPGPPPLSTPQQ